MHKTELFYVACTEFVHMIWLQQTMLYIWFLISFDSLISGISV